MSDPFNNGSPDSVCIASPRRLQPHAPQCGAVKFTKDHTNIQKHLNYSECKRHTADRIDSFGS